MPDSIEIEAHPLLSPDDVKEIVEESDSTDRISLDKTSVPRNLRLLLYISLLLNVILLLFYLSRSGHLHFSYGSLTTLKSAEIYSPAQSVVSTVHRRFPHRQEITLYMQPPSEEVDDAWSNLYNFGVSEISKDQAIKMVNTSVPIPGNEENYIIELDIWHQLHCLNTMRKALHPDYYPSIPSELIPDIRIPDDGSDMTLPEVRFNHLPHCINSIREALMCSVDITPNIWYGDVRVNKVAPAFDVVHECKNFDAIREWALDHRLEGTFDASIHILPRIN